MDFRKCPLVLPFIFVFMSPHNASADPTEFCVSVAEDIVGQTIELAGERKITPRGLHRATAVQISGIQTHCIADMSFEIIDKAQIVDAEVPNEVIEQAAYNKFCWGLFSSGMEIVKKYSKTNFIDIKTESRSDFSFVIAGDAGSYRFIESDIDSVFALISMKSAIDLAKKGGNPSKDLTQTRAGEVDDVIYAISQSKRPDFEARCIGKAEREAAALKKAQQEEADHIAAAARLEVERPAREKTARDAANAASSELERRIRSLTTERAQTLKNLALYERSAPTNVTAARKKLTDIDGELSRLQRELAVLR